MVENFGCVAFSSTLDLCVTLTTLCYDFISSVRNNNQIWKYIYIAMHNMISNLQNTAYLIVTNKLCCEPKVK